MIDGGDSPGSGGGADPDASSTDAEGRTAAAWAAFAEQLRTAGERLDALVAELPAAERADAFRALLRATNNQLGRLETDRERPELVAFNEWREKFLMDNPDFRYWVADVRDDRRYRITGSMAGAAYLSVTAYESTGVLGATANARIDSDGLGIDAQHSEFELTLSREPPAIGRWLALPVGARSVWVRMCFDQPADEQRAWCRIDALDAPPAPPGVGDARLGDRLARAGRTLAQWPRLVERAAAEDLARPNAVRHWTEMSGGAAFTEPGIHYLRGAWQLDEGEALVVEGPVPSCRYWSILLYSRFLNSLDHRHRTVSRTAATTALVDGRYRYVLAARAPGARVAGLPATDWLDTEGRPFGIFVLRFLHPEQPPELPVVRRVRLDETCPP